MRRDLMLGLARQTRTPKGHVGHQFCLQCPIPHPSPHQGSSRSLHHSTRALQSDRPHVRPGRFSFLSSGLDTPDAIEDVPPKVSDLAVHPTRRLDHLDERKLRTRPPFSRGLGPVERRGGVDATDRDRERGAEATTITGTRMPSPSKPEWERKAKRSGMQALAGHRDENFQDLAIREGEKNSGDSAPSHSVTKRPLPTQPAPYDDMDLDGSSRRNVGWRHFDFNSMRFYYGGKTRGLLACKTPLFSIMALPVKKQPERKLPFPPHLLRKRSEPKVIAFGFVAKKVDISKLAVRRNREVNRLKAAVNQVVNEGAGLKPDGDKGWNLLSSNYTYLATIGPKMVSAKHDEIVKEVVQALKKIKRQAMGTASDQRVNAQSGGSKDVRQPKRTAGPKSPTARRSPLALQQGGPPFSVKLDA